MKIDSLINEIDQLVRPIAVKLDYEIYYIEYVKENGEYYYYKTRTNMMINIPIINDILNIPIYSNTNRLYNFG